MNYVDLFVEQQKTDKTTIKNVTQLWKIDQNSAKIRRKADSYR